MNSRLPEHVVIGAMTAIILLGLSACSGRYFEYHSAREIPEGPGVFTGEEGAVILGSENLLSASSRSEEGVRESRRYQDFSDYQSFQRCKDSSVDTPDCREFRDWQEWKKYKSLQERMGKSK